MRWKVRLKTWKSHLTKRQLPIWSNMTFGNRNLRLSPSTKIKVGWLKTMDTRIPLWTESLQSRKAPSPSAVTNKKTPDLKNRCVIWFIFLTSVTTRLQILKNNYKYKTSQHTSWYEVWHLHQREENNNLGRIKKATKRHVNIKRL